MSDNILPILTFAGLLVGFASTIWGLFAKPTFEDGKGNTRLTSQGQVTVALAGFAFLISVSSFGFGLIAERADAQKKLDEALLAQEEKRLREVRDLKQFALTKETLNEVVNTRFQQYQLDLQRQAADARAARRISGENQANLAGITSTLDGVERLLKPIGPISGELGWTLRLDAEDVAILRQKAACEDIDYNFISIYTSNDTEQIGVSAESLGIWGLADFLEALTVSVSFDRFREIDLSDIEQGVGWNASDDFYFYFACEDNAISIKASFEDVRPEFGIAGIYPSVGDLRSSSVMVRLGRDYSDGFTREFDARFESLCFSTSGIELEEDLTNPAQWQQVANNWGTQDKVDFRPGSCD